MAELRVGLVAADREVWTGEARMVIAKTTEGDLGVLPGHAPLLGVLVNGVVEIRPVEGSEAVRAVVHGGFLSVAGDTVSILGDEVELADEIDAGAARSELDRAVSEGDTDAARRARARLSLGER